MICVRITSSWTPGGIVVMFLVFSRSILLFLFFIEELSEEDELERDDLEEEDDESDMGGEAGEDIFVCFRSLGT